MKRYIAMSAMVLFASCGLYTGTVFGSSVTIAPTTEGEDSIVDAIKYYSNITERDVSKYKLLALGSVGTFGAFMLGAASTIGAGVGAYKKADIVQSITPERVPGWMTNALVLAALGSASGYALSSKILNSRTRTGVIPKVQGFIDVCKSIHEDSPMDTTRTRYSIVNWPFYDLSWLNLYLPESWPKGDNVATYNALYNLAQQGIRAQLLLNQIGTDDEYFRNNNTLVKSYTTALLHNVGLYAPIISEENKKKREAAELAGIEAGTSLMKAKTIETYGNMITGAVKTTWSGLNYIYENKEKIIARATVASVAVIGAYAYIKAKLGYGE
jgi:hypothetical protein